eukprot:sb/3464846/
MSTSSGNLFPLSDNCPTLPGVYADYQARFGLNSTRDISNDFLSQVNYLSLLGSTQLLIGGVGVTLNGLTLSYYCRLKKQLFGCVHKTMTLVDVVSGVGAIILGLSIFWLLQGNPPYSYSIQFSSTVVMVLTRISAWNHLLLNLLRTQSVTSPSRSVANSTMVSLLLLPMVIWCGVALGDIFAESELPWVYHVRYNLIMPILGRGFMERISLSLCSTPWYPGIVGLLLVSPFLLPSILILILMITQVYVLIFKNRQVTRKSARSRKMAQTIVYLSLSYSICHSLYTVATLGDNKNSLILFFTSSTAPALHTMITPAILILRGRALQTYCLNVVEKYGVRRSNWPARVPGPPMAIDRNLTTVGEYWPSIYKYIEIVVHTLTIAIVNWGGACRKNLMPHWRFSGIIIALCFIMLCFPANEYPNRSLINDLVSAAHTR